MSAIKYAHRKCRLHGLFRLHWQGHIFETSLRFFFLQAKILQVVEWWMQTSQCEYEPINQQPHFMRLRPPNCFVSEANYFGEIFLHTEKESVIIIERIQNRNSAVSTSRAQITSSLCFINFLNHSGPMDSK